MDPLSLITNPIESQAEDAMMLAIKGTGEFKAVATIGRGPAPKVLNTPAAHVFLVSDADTGNRPRPINDARFDVVVTAKNLGGEDKVARDVYSLMEIVRQSLQSKTFGIPGMGPLWFNGRTLVGYGAGIISYSMHFTARLFLPIPQLALTTA